LPPQTTWATALSWGPAGYLASVAAGGVDVWDVASGERVGRIERRAPIARVELLADRAVVLGTDATLAVVAAARRLLVGAALGPAPSRMRVTADGFAVVADGQAPILSIVELGTGAVVRARADHIASSLALSPDGQWLVTGSAAGALTLWDPATLQMIAALAGTDYVTGLAIAGRLLAAGTSSGARLVDPGTGGNAATP